MKKFLRLFKAYRELEAESYRHSYCGKIWQAEHDLMNKFHRELRKHTDEEQHGYENCELCVKEDKHDYCRYCGRNGWSCECFDDEEWEEEEGVN